MTTHADEALFLRYLVGDCADEERERVEEWFFTDADAFDRLCELEEELIWRYARGELSAVERARFERAYSAPPRRDRLILTLALGRVIAETTARAALEPAGMTRASMAATPSATAQDTPWWRRWLTLQPAGARLALGTICALLAIGLVTQVRQARQLRATIDRSRQDTGALRQQAEGAARRAAESERRIAALSEEVTRAQPVAGESKPAPAVRPVIATFVLMPGRTRGTRDTTRITPSLNADSLRLQLNLEVGGAYSSFKAELRTSAGDLLWTQDRLQTRRNADGGAVVVTVPASLVADGEYEVDLFGHLPENALEDVDSYYFTVDR